MTTLELHTSLKPSSLSDAASIPPASAASATSGAVSRGSRRGMLANLTLVPEYHEPRDYPQNVKYLVTFIIAVCSVIGPLGSSILLPSIPSVCEDLDTTVAVVNVSVGLYIILMGVMPLWWSSFSERHGRRNVYLVSFLLNFGFSIGNALSPLITALLVFRVFAGGASASVQSVGAGTISDMFVMEERGFALGLYYLGPLMGPLLAPILGGALSMKWGWRASQWLLVIWAGLCLCLVVVGLPETLRVQDSAENVRKVLHEQRMAAQGDSRTPDPEALLVEKGVGADSVGETDTKALRKLDSAGTPEPFSSTASASLHSLASLGSSASIASPGPITSLATRSSADPQLIARTVSRLSVGSFGEDADIFAYQNEGNLLPPLLRITTTPSRALDVLRHQRHHIEVALASAEEAEVPATRAQVWRHNAYIYLVLPLKSLHLLRYPPIVMAVSYSGPCFAILYFVNMTLSYEYDRAPYNFSSILVGLVYIPNSVTYLVTSIYGGKWTDYLLAKSKARNGHLSPESRISWNVVVAACVFPVLLMIVGWTFEFHTHWVTPLVGTALFGFATMTIIGVTMTYLVDQLPGKGATGVAVNNFVRMILAAICTFITEPLLVALGPGVLFSILTGLIILLAGNLYLVKKRGLMWREKYNLQEIYDLMQ